MTSLALGLVAWAWVLWLFYFGGQLIHIWLRGSLALQSNLNSVSTWGQYLALKKPLIVSRVFLETCAFILFEYGTTTLFPNIIPSGGSPIVKAAAAGLFGYGADNILDQLFGKFGWDKELPPRTE